MNIEDLTLDTTQSVEVKADIGDVFKGVLYRFGEGNQRPDGVSMEMTLEEWAGGRWFRDRGEGIQHLWGHETRIEDLRRDYSASGAAR